MAKLWIALMFLLISFPLQESSAQEIVNITILHNAVKEGAVCLDGSPPAYYLRRRNSPNWLLFLRGGGVCYGDSKERSCLSRSTSELGSSQQMSEQISLNFGILSISKKNNPDFWNWNHVEITYCDGGSYLGDVEKPVQVFDTETNKTRYLYYRGRKIWNYTIRNLLQKGMKHANQVLLSGCSVGATATAVYCNDFKQLLPHATVKCLMDGGLFVNLPDITGNYSLQSIFDITVREHNITLGIERNYVPTNAAYKQLFPPYILPSIKQPMFLLNSAYDTWQIRNTLLYPTAEWRPCVLNSSSCHPRQLQILQGFRSSFLTNISPAFEKEKWGFFINSCFHHCQGDVSTVRVNNQTILEAIGNWMYERQKKVILVDFLSWPNNPTCVTYFEDTWL
ncbi:pectin acetylesterase 8 [Selaginella moellendorffii]|nr:pectin acetylesterase 8 [Selaginella moellendorffii]|eukprot:XP_002988519.2 pectin acetylesterase 8 [Selaginella moellendorffii]